jgi:uncharacterized protein
MAVEWWMYLVVCPLIFLAGFVDSIAGGGGVLSLPVYLLTGMPAQFAAASNKFSASSGTIVASIKYFRSNKIDVAAALVSAAFAFPGSYLGATIAMILSSNTLKIIMLVAVPLAALSVLFTKTKKKKHELSRVMIYILCAIIGLIIGIYDGLIGPGTGTFLILAYTLIVGYDMTTSSGNAKIVNLSSNLAALVAFSIKGYVIYSLAIPAALCAIAGGYLGSHLAINKGSKIIRPLLYVVLALIFIKLIFDLLF